MINVIAVITASPGKRGELLAAFKENVRAVYAEEGCIEYAATIDANGFGKLQALYGEDTFVVLEKWESKEHLMKHAVADHMKVYAKKTKHLIVDRKIHIMTVA